MTVKEEMYMYIVCGLTGERFGTRIQQDDKTGGWCDPLAQLTESGQRAKIVDDVLSLSLSFSISVHFFPFPSISLHLLIARRIHVIGDW